MNPIEAIDLVGLVVPVVMYDTLGKATWDVRSLAEGETHDDPLSLKFIRTCPARIRFAWRVETEVPACESRHQEVLSGSAYSHGMVYNMGSLMSELDLKHGADFVGKEQVLDAQQRGVPVFRTVACAHPKALNNGEGLVVTGRPSGGSPFVTLETVLTHPADA